MANSKERARPDEQARKIPVLLAEYNTLRSEVMTARTNVTQTITITATIVVAALGFTFKTGVTWHAVILFAAVTSLALLYLYFAFRWNERNTRAFTSRIREIESDVNRRVGERLLLWETDYGWGSIFPRNLNSEYKGYSYRPQRHFREPR